MQKRLFLASCIAAMVALAAPVHSLVVDAPHNATNNVSCSTCHSYSLWWQYSPTNQSTNPDHAAIVNTVCMTCHDGTTGKPMALTHSAAVIGSISHGPWGVGCTDCHNPHSQEQLNWVGSASPYLVTGTIASVSYAGPPVDQTTITYSGATANANWPPAGAQGSDPDWANKSLGHPDRGLILIHDTVSRTNSFAIVTATASQVVVKGELPSSAIDPAYVDPQTQAQNPATCSTFGLIYGQLIKSSIAAKPVKFFDPNGGFVQAGTETAGICQVCHTLTSRYTASGVLPAGSDTHLGREGMNCTSCHSHAGGFGGGNTHGASDFAWAGNCATCHNPDNASISIVATIHGGTCGMCHVNPAGGGPRKAGDPANGVDGSAIGAVGTSTCVDCHITAPALTSSAIHHTSAHGYAAAGDCSQCHQAATGKLAADHSASIATSANCSGCHDQTAGTAAGAPVDPANPRLHDACTTCHETTGALRAPAGTASAMPAGGGNCEACHGAYFNGHSHGLNHDMLMRPSDLAAQGMACNTCHRRGGTASPNPLFTNAWPGSDGILALHQTSCSLCHDSTRTTKVAPGYGSVQAVIMTGVNVGCLDCHYQASHPPGHDFVWGGTCNTCHSGPDITADVHKNKCDICHLDSGGGGARKAGRDGDATAAVSGQPATCLTCHPPATYPAGGIHHDTPMAATNNCTTACHPSVDHSPYVAPTPACAVCHVSTAGTSTGMPVDMANGMIHDSCRTCHTFNPTTLVGALVAPTGKRGVSVMAIGSCTTCHTATAPTIHHPGNAHALVGQCEYCHPDPRNKAGGMAFQETAPSGGIPTHLPCEECHVTPKNTTGWAGNQMTILAFNEGGSHSTTNYSSDFTRSTAHSGGHVIANSVGRINNWGICFSCHDGSSAVRVSVLHAKPTFGGVGTQASVGSTGDRAYAPGREARNTMGNFDFFAATFRPTSTYGSGLSSSQASEWTATAKYGSTDFPASDLVIPDPWGTATVTVPMFPAQAANTATTPAADNVKVSYALWDGSNIIVAATNTSGCGALTAIYNGMSQSFTGTTTCMATFDPGITYTSSVPTVDVTTSNADGLGVSGYRISTP